MNPALKTSPAVADDLLVQMRQQLARKDQALQAAEAIIQELREALRLERIKRFGKQSEKLSDLQLELLVASLACPAKKLLAKSSAARCRNSLQTIPRAHLHDKAAGRAQNSSGRNELPAHLKRVEKIIACAPEQCTCGQCGQENKVIGYERTELLSMKPAEYFVTVLMREKRACTDCKEQGVATAPARTYRAQIDLRR